MCEKPRELYVVDKNNKNFTTDLHSKVKVFGEQSKYEYLY